MAVVGRGARLLTPEQVGEELGLVRGCGDSGSGDDCAKDPVDRDHLYGLCVAETNVYLDN